MKVTRWLGGAGKSIPKSAVDAARRTAKSAAHYEAQAAAAAAEIGGRAAGAAGAGATTTAAAAAALKTNPGASVSGLLGPANDGGVFSNMMGGMSARLGQFGDGWGIAKKAGGYALRGAVGGAAIGGTTEAAQGGSFWDGAKSGAFNGAVGWSAYRMAGHAVGATSRNPFNQQGLFHQAKQQYSGVSKQVSAIVKAKQAAATAANVNGLK